MNNSSLNDQIEVCESQIRNYNRHHELAQQFGIDFTYKHDNDGQNNYKKSHIHRKVNHRFFNSQGYPPRPFKKARFAWEIKNFDFTFTRMCEGASTSENEMLNEDCTEERYKIPKNYDSDDQEINENMSSPNHMPTNIPEYQSYFGAQHMQRLTKQEALLSEQALVPADPDACLIRWHTQQLCRSIFDNTVNRMLENMGFSPVTEQSQNPHPLLVLNHNEDEDKVTDGACQRLLEAQAFSVALQHKDLFSPCQYDALDSASTSEYDSSEDSDLGEGGMQEEIASENSKASLCNAHLSINSQYPSLDNQVSRQLPNYDSNLNLHSSIACPEPSVDSCNIHCTSAQITCSHPVNSLFEQIQVLSHPSVNKKQSNMCVRDCALRCSSNCPSLQCGIGKNDEVKVNDIENCISFSDQKTVIQGKVEGILNDSNHEINFDNRPKSDNENGSNDDKYFIRNSIGLTLKQQGLGFQKV